MSYQILITIIGVSFLVIGISMRKEKKPNALSFIVGGLAIIILMVVLKLTGLQL